MPTERYNRWAAIVKPSTPNLESVLGPSQVECGLPSLHDLLPEFAERTLPVDSVVPLKCAWLQVPDLQAERDALIAATAIVHGMTVVTRNVTDFETTGAAVVDPWAAA